VTGPVLAAAPIRPSDTAGAAIWMSGARDGSGETVDMLDVVPCVLAAPGRAASPGTSGTAASSLAI
jgi:hypothetical protein